MRHTNKEQQAIFTLKETAMSSKENRPVDPFMMCGLLVESFAMALSWPKFIRGERPSLEFTPRSCQVLGLGQALPRPSGAMSIGVTQFGQSSRLMSLESFSYQG